MQRNPLAVRFGVHAEKDKPETKSQKSNVNTSPQTRVKARFSGFFNNGGRHVMQDVTKLNGGLTNETYLVRTNSNQYVARIPGKGSEKYINRVNESHDTAIAFAAGATPEVVYDERNGVKVTRYLPKPMELNRSMLKRPECLLEVVNLLKKLHATEPFASTIDVFARNKQWAKAIEGRGWLLPVTYVDAANEIDNIQGIFKDFKIIKVPCHNDLTPGNFIFSDGRLQLIDFEYGGNNDPVWDLAYLAMEADFTEGQGEFMLRAYFGDEMTDDVVRRFYLYQPVIEYTVALWFRLQMANGNIIGDDEELAAQERKRFASYQALMKSAFIQKELNQSIPDGAMHAVEKDDDVEKKPRCFSRCRR